VVKRSSSLSEAMTKNGRQIFKEKIGCDTLQLPPRVTPTLVTPLSKYAIGDCLAKRTGRWSSKGEFIQKTRARYVRRFSFSAPILFSNFLFGSILQIKPATSRIRQPSRTCLH